MDAQQKVRSGAREPGGGGPGRPRSGEVDKAILQAAMTLFVKHGFGGVSVEQVAATAGVARTTVYRRWSSMEDLVAEAIAAERGEPESAVLASSAAAGVLQDRLADGLADVAAAPGYRDMIARLIGSVPDHPELMAVYWRAYLGPRRAAMREVLERAQAARLIRDDIDPEIVLDLISGALMHELLLRPGDRSPGELREHLGKAMNALGLEAGPGTP